jgi:hypothetical protein
MSAIRVVASFVNPDNVSVVGWMTRIVPEYVPIHNLILPIAVPVPINVQQERNVSMDHVCARVTSVDLSVPIHWWIQKIAELATISATLTKFVVRDTVRTLQDQAYKPIKIAVDVEALARHRKTAVQEPVRI